MPRELISDLLKAGCCAGSGAARSHSTAAARLRATSTPSVQVLTDWLFRLPLGDRRGSGRRKPVGRYLERMRARDLYSKIRGVSGPWHVSDVLIDMPADKVEVIVER